MSKSTAAKALSAATGMAYASYHRLERAGRTRRARPVPDAISRSQTRFEAMAVSALAAAFRDRQPRLTDENGRPINGAVLGITRIDLHADRPICFVQPRMANRLVRALLPEYDETQGELRGVPGARPVNTGGHLVIRDLLSDAAIELRRDDQENPHLPMPGNDAPEPFDWQHGSAHDLELQQREDREAATNYGLGRPARPEAFAARDRLFSRLLRRPLIINRCSPKAHGAVNTYTHGDDLVLEWCCDASHQQIRDLLETTGMIDKREMAWASLSAVGNRGDSAIEYTGTSHSRPYGITLLTFRSGQTCPNPRLFKQFQQGLTRWYQ